LSSYNVSGNTGSAVTGAGNVHSGTYAFTQTGRNEYYNGIKQTVTVNMNRTYNYSVWFKTGADASDMREFQLTDDQNPWTALQGVKSLSGTTSWQNLEFDHKIPADKVDSDNVDEDGNYPLALLFCQKSTSSLTNADTIFVDDFSVSPIYYVSDIVITGSGGVMIPSDSDATSAYSAVVKNQNGNTTEMPQVVKWSLETAAEGISVDANTGELTVSSTASAGTVTVMATSTDHGVAVTAKKAVTIAGAMNDTEAAQAAADGILVGDFSSEPLNAITQNLSFPSIGAYGAALAWRSNTPSVVTDDGAITVPDVDTQVTLTATANCNGQTADVTIKVTVLASRNIATNNPGFESGNTSGWSVNDGSAKITLVTDSKHSGSYAGLTSDVNASHPRVQYSATVKNNVPYVYSIWVKLAAGSADTTMGLRLFDTGGSAIGYVVPQSHISVSAAHDWVQMAGTYTIDGNLGGTTTLYVSPRVEDGIQYYVDDIAIYPSNGETTISDVELYSAGGNTTSFLDDGAKSLTGTIAGNVAANTVVSAGINPATVTMVMGVYDGDRLVDVSLKTETVGASERKNIYNTIYCADTSYNVKVLLLDGLDTLKPLKESKQI